MEKEENANRSVLFQGCHKFGLCGTVKRLNEISQKILILPKIRVLSHYLCKVA